MSTSYISSGVHCVGHVVLASPYTYGLRSRFRFRGSTPPAFLILIKNKKKAENDEKQKQNGGRGKRSANRKLLSGQNTILGWDCMNYITYTLKKSKYILIKYILNIY